MTVTFRCPSCHATFRVEDSSLGKTVICPNPGCNRKAVLPKAGETTPAKQSRSKRDGKAGKLAVEKSPEVPQEMAPQLPQSKSNTFISKEVLLVTGIGSVAIILITVFGLVMLLRPSPPDQSTIGGETDRIAIATKNENGIQKQASAIKDPATPSATSGEQSSFNQTLPDSLEQTQLDTTNHDPVQSKSLTVEDVASKTESSIAFIEGAFGTGTGFLIRDGIVATNRHVIEEELHERLKIHFPSAPDGERGPFACELIYKDPDNDLAFLRVQTSLKPLTTDMQHSFRRGQDVIVIGNPGAIGIVLQNAVSRGVMSTEVTLFGQQYYQLGISINSGNSGGPVLDMSGQVLGVLTLKARQQEGVAFCVPLPQLNEALGKLDQLSDQDIAAVCSQHRLGVVVHTVSTTASFYEKGMQIYLDSMQKAMESGGTASSGLEKVRNEVTQALRGQDRWLVDTDLSREATRVSSDPNIPDRIRGQFADLWTNYKEMKSSVENPRGTFETFHTKFLQLSDKHDRLMHALHLHLGIKDE